MTAILTKAGGYIAIILLGWVLRKTGFFKENDYKIIMKVVLNITLPASIIYSYAGKVIDFSLLAIAFLGLLLGFLHMGVGYICAVSGEKTDRAFSLLNISGYNIGNFTLPFAQGLLGAEGVIATSLFGIGNSFICLGMACSFASMIRNGTHFSWKTILKDLVRSIPFDAYFFYGNSGTCARSAPGGINRSGRYSRKCQYLFSDADARRVFPHFRRQRKCGNAYSTSCSELCFSTGSGVCLLLPASFGAGIP